MTNTSIAIQRTQAIVNFLRNAYLRHKASWKCCLSDEEAIGRVIYETAFGSMFRSRIELSHEERALLKEFCCEATGHNHFTHINCGLIMGAGNMKAIGRAAIAIGLF